MRYPTGNKAAAFNRAALEIALECVEPCLSVERGLATATLGFDGYGPDSAAQVVLEVERTVDLVIEVVAFHRKPLSSGLRPLELIWSRSDHPAHMRAGLAPLFAPEAGEVAAGEAILREAFDVLRRELDGLVAANGGIMPPSSREGRPRSRHEIGRMV